MASPAENEAVVRDNKGFSEETCVRCGWRMGSPALNCQNDATPHQFPSQVAALRAQAEAGEKDVREAEEDRDHVHRRNVALEARLAEAHDLLREAKHLLGAGVPHTMEWHDRADAWYTASRAALTGEGTTDPTEGLPDDLARVLRDQSIIVPQDAAVFDLIGKATLPDGRDLWEALREWQNAPSNTASADIPEDES